MKVQPISVIRGGTLFEGIDKEINKLGEAYNVGAVIGVGGRLKDTKGNPTDKVIMHYVAVVRVIFENPRTKIKDTRSYFFDANTGIWAFIANRNYGNALKAYFERIYNKWTHEHLISIPMSSQNCQQLTPGKSGLSNGLNAQKLLHMRRAMNSTPRFCQELERSAPKSTLLELGTYHLNITQRLFHFSYCLNWPTADKQKMIAKEHHPTIERLIRELEKALSFINECIKIRERATFEIRQEISGEKTLAEQMQSESTQQMIRQRVTYHIINEQIITEQDNVEKKILVANSGRLAAIDNANHRNGFLSELQKLIETQKEKIQRDIKKRFQNQPRDVTHMVDMLMEDSQSETKRRAENSVREILLDKLISNDLHQERIRTLVQQRLLEKKVIASSAQSHPAEQAQSIDESLFEIIDLTMPRYQMGPLQSGLAKINNENRLEFLHTMPGAAFSLDVTIAPEYDKKKKAAYVVLSSPSLSENQRLVITQDDLRINKVSGVKDIEELHNAVAPIKVDFHDMTQKESISAGHRRQSSSVSAPGRGGRAGGPRGRS